MRGTLRALGWLVGGVSVSIFLLAGAIHLDQYLLRRRAELLLSDIRSLELRKSTYADARRVIDRWWDEARQDGPCRPDWCDIKVTITDLAWSHADFNVNTPTRSRIFRWLGARPATVDASIRVRNNAVIGKRIGGYILGPCINSDGQTFCTTIIGRASTGRRRYIDLRHPEYTFYKPSGCEICVEADVIFSAYADPADVRRLTDVNFGCITRWTPCENEEDILPTAWAEAHSEGGPLARTAGTCSETVRALSRELRCLPLASVTRVTNAGEGPQLSVRWEDQCGMAQNERQNTVPQPDRDVRIRAGDRLLVFEDQLFHFSNPCAVVPATEENLHAAREGVSEDLSDHPQPVYLPVGGINPPHIDVR